MSNVKRWFILTMLFLSVLGIAGCSTKDMPDRHVSDFKEMTESPGNIPDKNVKDLEDITKHGVGFIALVNSDTGENKFLKNSEIKVEPVNSAQPASEIRKITSVSIIGVSGIKIENTSYDSCNYISFDDKRELICANNKNQEPQPSPGIPDMSAELAKALGEAGNINNVGFLLLTDFSNGETKLVKNKNYIRLSANLPQAISAIKSSRSWSKIYYKVNPCKMLVDDGNGGWKWQFSSKTNC